MSHLALTVENAVKQARTDGCSQFLVRDLKELAYISAELYRFGDDIESRFDARAVLVTVSSKPKEDLGPASTVTLARPGAEVVEEPETPKEAPPTPVTAKTTAGLTKSQKRRVRRNKRKAKKRARGH